MLKLSKTLELPVDFATQTVAILARKRVGKTYTASVIAEECCEAKIPFVVLDPTGAWYGLRSSKDGKKPGYPVIIIGGAHGDIPLEFTAGKLIAEFVVENPGYYVLDLSGSESDAEQDRFATSFAQRLYRLKDKHREPLHLFVDEADSFAPQTPFPGQRVMLGAFEALVRRGGIRGIGITLITQRSAVLNNNVLMQAEVLIALQTTGPADIAAVDKWIKLNATKEQRDEFLASVASLGMGEAWVWSPAWLEIFEKVQIRERRTFNSSATPKVGEQKVEPARLADVDLEALKTSMAATIEKVTAEDPKNLKKKIAELQIEIIALSKENNSPSPETVEVTKEVPVFPLTVKTALDDLGLDLSRNISHISGQLDEMVKYYHREAEAIVAKHANLSEGIVGPNKLKPRKDWPVPTNNGEDFPKWQEPHRPQKIRENTAPSSLSRPQQKLLDVLASFEPLGLDSLSKSNLAVFADVSPKSSSFQNNLGTLRNASGQLGDGPLVEYLAGSNVKLTDLGRAFADGSKFSATTNRELLTAWCRKLSGPQGRILEALFEVHPDQLSRQDLADIIDASIKSSSFQNNLGSLRGLGLIDYGTRGDDKTVYATELLFPFSSRAG